MIVFSICVDNFEMHIKKINIYIIINKYKNIKISGSFITTSGALAYRQFGIFFNNY
jgi:hypothetical protein